jgi:tetratricopeptide (TPR) repeat protein
VAGYTTNIAIVDAELGDRDAALRGYARALAVRRSLGNPRAIASTLINRGRLRIDAGDLAGAATDLLESLQLAEADDDRNVVSACLLELGRVKASQGDVAAGLQLLARASTLAAAAANDHLAAEIHRHTIDLLPCGSDEAARHIRSAYDLYARIGDPWADRLAGRHADILSG